MPNPGGTIAQTVKRLRSPFEEAIPLAVSVELHLRVEAERIFSAEIIDLHGMIDDEIDRYQRLHPPDVKRHDVPRPSASPRDRRAAAPR